MSSPSRNPLRNLIREIHRRSLWQVLGMVPSRVSEGLSFVPLLFPVLLVTGCGQSPSPSHQFALVGDAPYGDENVPRLQALIDEVNADPHISWVIHVGDIKGGISEPCTDEILRSRFHLYQGFSVPFVFTPGDNEWFDCGGEAQGGYDAYERLDFVRSLFFPDPARTTGESTMEVRSQGAEPGYEEFVENALWTRDGIVYATVHLLGLGTPEPQPVDPGRAAHRMDAALAWIDTAFDLAEDGSSRAVFIAMQADPWAASGNPGVLGTFCETCVQPRPGLERLYPTLVARADAFPGPVVLAVGDTHVFRVDKPLYRDDGPLVENFTRVETFGNPYTHWVRVTVDPEDPEVFSFDQELVEENTLKDPRFRARIRGPGPTG